MVSGTRRRLQAGCLGLFQEANNAPDMVNYNSQTSHNQLFLDSWIVLVICSDSQSIPLSLSRNACLSRGILLFLLLFLISVIS